MLNSVPSSPVAGGGEGSPALEVTQGGHVLEG